MCGLFQHIIISPEQASRSGSTLPLFSRLLEDTRFVRLIKRVNIDEVHWIATAGRADSKGKIFRPEYAKLQEVLIRLRTGTPCAMFTATLPPDARAIIEDSLKIPLSDPSKTSVHMLSVNRPNFTYAVVPLNGSTSNLSNLNCLIPAPYHPPMGHLAKKIIFVDSMELAVRMEMHLTELLPASMRASRPIRRLYSLMSKFYKDDVISEFAKREGGVQIVIATAACSNVRLHLL